MSAKEAIDFLEALRPGGPWLLTAINPDNESILSKTMHGLDAAEAFVNKWNRKRNLYYSVNPTRTALNKKAAKTDIAAIEYALADLDPNDNETSEAAKTRYLKALEHFEPKPTALIDSGNGLQCLWRLKNRIELGTPVNGKFAPADQAKIDDLEARVAAIMLKLGAKPGTQNIDRILRLPGTTNLPNATKKREGRVTCPTKPMLFNGAKCVLTDFPKPKPTQNDTINVVDINPYLAYAREVALDNVRELVEHGAPQGDRSDSFHAVVCRLLEGGWSCEQILALLQQHPRGIAEKYRKRLKWAVDYSFERWSKQHIEPPDKVIVFVKSKPKPRTRLTVLHADQIETKPIVWLWANRLARGALTIISGLPGLLKSQITFYCAARISRGDLWVDGGQAPLGNVFILSAEDAADTVIVPRLEAAGADLKRIRIIKASVIERNGKNHYFKLQDDLDLVAEEITAWGNVALLIVDPVSAFMGSIDSHRTTDVRAVLGPVADFAETHNIAVLGIMHPPKAIAGNKAVNAISGSLAFVAAPRLTFLAVEEQNDPNDPFAAHAASVIDYDNPRRLLLPDRNRLGPKATGLGYRHSQRAVSNNINASFVEWDDLPVTISADEALAATATSGRKANKLDEAKDWLRYHLQNGPVPASDILDAAEEQDISERTLNRAKTALHIITERSGFQGALYWRLPKKTNTRRAPAL